MRPRWTSSSAPIGAPLCALASFTRSSAKYTLADLGPANISFASKRWHREDFVVPNDRGQCADPAPHYSYTHSLPRPWHTTHLDAPVLHASWWRVSPVIPRPCVIYLHTNSGSRLEALDYLPLLMKLSAPPARPPTSPPLTLRADISLLAFDFAGSGLSEGEYVTLGAWEKRDVGSILAYVLGTGQATSVALWGRSMGAATALLAADLHKRFVRAVVADSSFASLPRLVQDVTQGRSATAKALVNVLVSLGMKMIGETIKQRAHFRLADVDPLAAVEASPVPTLYMHADRDGFVLPEHSRDLHAKCVYVAAPPPPTRDPDMLTGSGSRTSASCSSRATTTAFEVISDPALPALVPCVLDSRHSRALTRPHSFSSISCSRRRSAPRW